MSLLPYDDRDGLIWLDGKLVPFRDAKLHVLTHGLHYASAVFEGERAYGGEVFHLTEHSQRLIDSGKLLDFTIPYSVEEIDRATRETVAANKMADCYIRPIAWMWLGNDGRFGAAEQNPCRHRGVGVAELLFSGSQDERPAPADQRLAPARAEHGPDQGEGGRPVHDLHAVQAQGRA